MTRKLNHAVRHWLQLERAGQPEKAENALQQVFYGLPEEAVPAGFADRVLTRAGLMAPALSEHSWAAYWGIRAAISICLVLMALFLLVIPSYLPALLGIFNLSRAAEVGIGALVGVFYQLGAGLVIWRAFSAAGAILSSILSSPQSLTVIFLAVVLSMAALRVLHDVLVAERSSRYVGSA